MVLSSEDLVCLLDLLILILTNCIYHIENYYLP